tara:strand:+ start:630 stop:1076 length:447 start_codon:yes stop_codon:yes gene_type:complete
MNVILIAAITADGYIARHSNETVDWSLDLHLFKEQTMGYPVIMGSKTKKTLALDLKGRNEIVVNRNDKPKTILDEIKADKCFVIGGGITFTRFSTHLTHLYITIHPLIFGKGVTLFPNLKREMNLTLIKMFPVQERENLYQFQYKINR